jgi:putative cell wall-binding protein
VSRHAFDAAPAVVLARADQYPDAVAAAPVAARLGGPVLLTPTPGLHPSVRAEIVRLGATRAHLMGDASALSPQVETDLRAAGVRTITRSAGSTRFDTARLAAEMTPTDHVYLVEGANSDPGRGWPDAVSVSALAAHQRRPVLLVHRDHVPDATIQALQDMDVTAATIVGGVSAVSGDVQRQIEAQGVRVDRLDGPDRYHTSVEVASASVEAGLDPSRVWVATGRNWPDSLTAGPAAAHSGDVLLLIDGRRTTATAPAARWLRARPTPFEQLPVVGGPDVVVPATVITLDVAATGR